MKKYYAGIGSSETPDNIFKLMTEIASILEDKDYILRSGASTGAEILINKSIFRCVKTVMIK